MWFGKLQNLEIRVWLVAKVFIENSATMEFLFIFPPFGLVWLLKFSVEFTISIVHGMQFVYPENWSLGCMESSKSWVLHTKLCNQTPKVGKRTSFPPRKYTQPDTLKCLFYLFYRRQLPTGEFCSAPNFKIARVIKHSLCWTNDVCCKCARAHMGYCWSINEFFQSSVLSSKEKYDKLFTNCHHRDTPIWVSHTIFYLILNYTMYHTKFRNYGIW